MRIIQTNIKIGNIEIVKPRQIVYDILRYKQSGTVLDLGSGFGRHSLFLAYNGFHVTAIEKEQNKLNTLIKNANKLGVNIITIRSDATNLILKERYDVIVSTMVLHFLTKDKARKVITTMQEYTNKEGLNVISVYTNENPAGLRSYLFEKNELRDAYRNWEILEYVESLGQEIENPEDGGPNRRYSAKLIAKKI